MSTQAQTRLRSVVEHFRKGRSFDEAVRRAFDTPDRPVGHLALIEALEAAFGTAPPVRNYDPPAPTLAQVGKLRAFSGAGLVECRRALQEQTMLAALQAEMSDSDLRGVLRVLVREVFKTDRRLAEGAQSILVSAPGSGE